MILKIDAMQGRGPLPGEHEAGPAELDVDAVLLELRAASVNNEILKPKLLEKIGDDIMLAEAVSLYPEVWTE